MRLRGCLWLLLLLSLLWPSLVRADITTGLTLWLKFDEGTGTTAANSGSSGDTGTLSGGPTWQAAVVGAYGLRFANGGLDIVNVSGTTVYAPTASAFSVALWLYFDGFLAGPNTAPHLLVLRSGTTTPWELAFTNDATCGIGLYAFANASFYKVRVNRDMTLLQSAWHHLAVTYNGADAGTVGNFAVYLDGVAQPLTTTTCGSNKTQETALGSYASAGAGQDWAGALDDVRVYSRALSASDVLEAMSYQDPGFASAVLGNRTVSGADNFGWDVGTTDAYAVTLVPALTQYRIGARYLFRANSTNSGPATLAINGLGAVPLKKVLGGVLSDLLDNDIRVGQLVEVVYDGTNMLFMSPPSGTTQTIASGAIALATASIASGTCATEQTATVAGALTTDTVLASFAGDVTGITGYTPSTTGTLRIDVYPKVGQIGLRVCNATASAIVPGAVTLNYRVVR